MNPKTSVSDLSRRKFIGACCASVGATGMLSALAQLRLIGAVANPDNGTLTTPGTAAATQPDFKALVCLFLAGGNDANNLLVPTDATTYAAYAAGRGVLSLPQNSLLPITPKTSDQNGAPILNTTMPETAIRNANSAPMRCFEPNATEKLLTSTPSIANPAIISMKAIGTTLVIATTDDAKNATTTHSTAFTSAAA